MSGAFGFGPCLWAWVAGLFAVRGIALNAAGPGGSHMGLQPRSFVVFGAMVPSLIDAVYFFITGDQPRSYILLHGLSAHPGVRSAGDFGPDTVYSVNQARA